MIVFVQTSEEFFAVLAELKASGRQAYSLHHPRAKDRWLWKIDVSEPTTTPIAPTVLTQGDVFSPSDVSGAPANRPGAS